MSNVQIGGLARNPRTAPGRVAKTSPGILVDTFRSGAGPTGQQTLLDLGAPDSTALYSVEFAGGGVPTQLVSVTTGAGATDVSLGNLLAAATAANPYLSPLIGSITREGGSGQDVRINWRAGVDAFVVTPIANPSSAVVVVNVAAGAGTPAPFGRFWRITDGASFGDNRILSPLAALAGPVVTGTITHGAGAAYNLLLLADGTPVSIAWNAGADAAATTANAVAAAEAALPAATGVAVSSSGTNNLTLSCPVGVTASVVSTIAAGGGGSPALVATAAAGSALPKVALIHDPGDEVPETIGGAVVATRSGSPISGLLGLAPEVGVEYPGAAITFGSVVWVETAAGANNGRPFGVASPSRFRVAASWVRRDEVDGDLALISIAVL